MKQLMNKGKGRTKHNTQSTKGAAVKKKARPMGPMTTEHEKWDEFIDQLYGADGCNFHLADPNDSASTTWTCDSTGTFVISRRLLTEMGLTPTEIGESIEYFGRNGGYCDCEVFLNVDPFRVEDERVDEEMSVVTETLSEREKAAIEEQPNFGKLSSDATVESAAKRAYERAKDHAARGGARGAYPGEMLASPVLRMRDPAKGYAPDNVEFVCLAVLLLEEAGFPIEEVVAFFDSAKHGRRAGIRTDDASTAGSVPGAAVTGSVTSAEDRLRPEDNEGGGKVPCP